MKDNRCENEITKNPGAACILYDDAKCNHRKGLEIMENGKLIKNLENTAYFEVQSISVRRGCRLTVYTGNPCIRYWHKEQ